MSYFHKLDETLEASEPEQHEAKPSAGSRLADLGDRIARAFTPVDRGQVELPALEPGEPGPPEPIDEGAEITHDFVPRFAVAPFGYNRAAVDGYIAELERELQDRRTDRPDPVSITEEIERIGEQTASILVVAHDQAHETTRRAQEQADRCIADAADNAVQITARAKEQLRELDSETDVVWRERSRLLEDAQSTGSALIALAQQARERFPADTKPEETRAMEPVRFEE